ncbi:glycosyltransferase [Massilia sp. 2TAF26]|uniref:glycosyltransferase n=1 Tax=Massilia sp. 2TAF26 TaxID=3233012 RepID=UPI003F9CCBD1
MKNRTTETLKNKLAIYLPSLGGGGAERVTGTLANAIAERGVNVDLVLAQATGPYLAHVSPAVNIVDLGASRVLTSCSGLINYLREERPTATLSVLNHANVIAIAARAMSGVRTRLVVSEHNTLSSAVKGRVSLRGSIEVGAMKFSYPRADAIVGVSNGVSDDLAKALGLPRSRVNTVYNPIDAVQIKQKSLESVDHPWFAPGQPPVIVAIGRLTRQKNFEHLLNSFALLRSSRGIEARLMILGEGELRSDLEEQVKTLGLSACVALPGFVSNPYAYLRAAGLFVLSSSWEGLPTVLIEAMSCEAKVVSTDCPSGPAEILENGKWGRVVPMDDTRALAAAMAAALADENPPNVYERASDFSVERSVDGYLQLLQISHSEQAVRETCGG